MSVDSVLDAATRAAEARARADARLLGAIDDLFLPDHARLSERTRLTVARRLRDTIDGVEAELRRRAARSLTADGADPAALLAGAGAAARLLAAGLLRDEALIEALVARVRCREIADALSVSREGLEETSLLVRLASVPDRAVASAARALLAAECVETPALPALVRTRLIWMVAAAIRPEPGDAQADEAIGEAASRLLDVHDEGENVEVAAMRLATAIDARSDELRPLLLEALGDRRLTLFVAVLAHGVGLEYGQAEAMVLEPDDERLWLALRAIGMDRSTIARIALALSDADPRRDIEAFADRLDTIAAIDQAAAQAALTPDLRAPAFRRAIMALARAEGA